jgi:hypothetical protein
MDEKVWIFLAMIDVVYVVWYGAAVGLTKRDKIYSA